MAGKRRAARADQEVAESLRGNRLLKPIMHLIERLHSVGTKCDRAGNRKLLFDKADGLGSLERTRDSRGQTPPPL
jgi:hypothetical protein